VLLLRNYEFISLNFVVSLMAWMKNHNRLIAEKLGRNVLSMKRKLQPSLSRLLVGVCGMCIFLLLLLLLGVWLVLLGL